MKIGIISDTHDNVDHVLKAVKAFNDAGVELVIHLGDVVAPGTIKYFKGLENLKLLQGNCDGDIDMIREICSEMGFEFLGPFADIELDGKKIRLMHYDPDRYAPEEIGKHDMIFHGHTHKHRDETVDGTRIINPGGHYYKADGTVAVLDVGSGEIEFINLGEKK